MKQTIFENKVVLGITCIPYIVIIFLAVYYGGIVGFRWMDSWCDGWYGFCGALQLIGLGLVTTPVGIPFLICVIYQIVYIVNWHKKRKGKNINRINNNNN